MESKCSENIAKERKKMQVTVNKKKEQCTYYAVAV